MPNNSQVLDLVERIERLGRGEAIISGGPSDVAYLRGQIAKLQVDPSIPSDTISDLVKKLSQVDPELSTWEARKNRQPEQKRAIFEANHAKKYGLEEGVVETIGLEMLNASEILLYHGNAGPFIKLPRSLTPGQVERLTRPESESNAEQKGFGYEGVTLGRNEALALFIDLGRVRKAEKLQSSQKSPEYLDKKIAGFIVSQAGNHGNMYFLGPPSDYGQEIKLMLSPDMVSLHSTYFGIPMIRGVTNLIGAVPEGSTLYRKHTLVLISPPA